jgi:D-amino peptidase
MKIYIQTDIEGCAGITFFDNRKNKSYENYHHRHRMQKLLTGEVNAAVKAAYKAGASEVLVNDNHGTGYNIIFEELDKRCEIVHGRSHSGNEWMPFIKEFDALILLGSHAMGGEKYAILPHSRWSVNNGEILLSESSMAAAVAGEFGITTILITGDNKITQEVESKIPEIETAVVKKAISTYQARSLIPAAACDLIASQTVKAIKKFKEGNIKPYIIDGQVELELYESEGHIPPLKPLTDRPVKGKTIYDAFINHSKLMPFKKFPVELPDGYQYP